MEMQEIVEIEVTEKMIEEGLERLREMSFRHTWEQVLSEVYLAMELQRRAEASSM